jgi:hypothetical protein
MVLGALLMFTLVVWSLVLALVPLTLGAVGALAAAVVHRSVAPLAVEHSGPGRALGRLDGKAAGTAYPRMATRVATKRKVSSILA